MSDPYDRGGGPPPFRKHRYSSMRGRGGRPGFDWERDLLGKDPGQSWSEYLGLGGVGASRGGKDPWTDQWTGNRGAGTGPDPGVDPRDAARHPAREGASMPQMDPMFRSPNPHRLYRNTKDGKLAGVCAGISDYINVDAWIVRLGLLLGLPFFFFPIVAGYVVLWVVLKERPSHLYESQEEERFWRSVTTRPDQTLAGLKTKFRELDRQIGSMETYVASREYDLHRQFRDLEKKK
ncbi:envelope stress response membrane protein PspC [Rhodocista pekingensis]|uniref:Envelope stress response membrane protein PspC n=1 Tax=Rhodocista pekingensis TaxID=201185 RepID=A0ABW2KXA2_9PROT